MAMIATMCHKTCFVRCAAVARSLATVTARRPVVAVFSGANIELEQAQLADVADLLHVPGQSWDSVPAAVLSQAEAALVWRMSGTLGEATLARFDRLRSVVRVGVGYESVDLEAAATAGIAVSNTPAYGVEEVADTAMAHILCLYRRTHLLASGVASGRIVSSLNSVVQREAVGATRMRGQSLGIIGLGRIGANVARKAQAFGFRVGFYDPHLPDGTETSHGGLTRHGSLDDLLAQSDCISLHATYNPSSHHLLSAASLARARRGVHVVNTARGGLIDDGALAEALASGAVGGAALDCQESEPDIGDPSRPSPYLALLQAEEATQISPTTSRGRSLAWARTRRASSASFPRSARSARWGCATPASATAATTAAYSQRRT